MFFLSKSPPGGYAISRPKHLELPVVSNLLIELFLIGMPVMRTDGQMGARSRDYKNFSDGWITKLSQVWGSARACVKLRYINSSLFKVYLQYSPTPPPPLPMGVNSDRRSITCTRDVDAVPVHAGAVITLALILFMNQSDYIQK